MFRLILSSGINYVNADLHQKGCPTQHLATYPALSHVLTQTELCIGQKLIKKDARQKIRILFITVL